MTTATNATSDERSPMLHTDAIHSEHIPQRSDFRLHKESGITWRRVLAFVLQIVPSMPLAGWILLSHDPPLELPEGNPLRNRLVFTWFLVVLVAYEGKILYMERRFMLLELLFVLPFLFPGMIACISAYTRRNDSAIGTLDVLAGILVVSGTILNNWPELQRAQWKKRPEHKGKLYTEGWFAYVRNPNYLGDVIWATGWALASSWEMLWVPLVILGVFVLLYIPEKESYLASRYSDEWPDYEARTVKLIPFLY